MRSLLRRKRVELFYTNWWCIRYATKQHQRTHCYQANPCCVRGECLRSERQIDCRHQKYKRPNSSDPKATATGEPLYRIIVCQKQDGDSHICGQKHEHRNRLRWPPIKARKGSRKFPEVECRQLIWLCDQQSKADPTDGGQQDEPQGDRRCNSTVNRYDVRLFRTLSFFFGQFAPPPSALGTLRLRSLSRLTLSASCFVYRCQ